MMRVFQRRGSRSRDGTITDVELAVDQDVEILADVLDRGNATPG
jgi:hypothetical protein